MPRILHTMLKVESLDRSLSFYVGVLGMRELRRGRSEEERKTNVFVGYGEEADTAVLELTEYFDRPALTHGSAFGHVAIALPDVAATCALVRARGLPILRDAAPIPGRPLVIALVEDPDGFVVELVQRE